MADDELRQYMIGYQGGSMEAFERLYAATAPALRGYLGSLSRDRACATDLLQEAFLQVHRSRHTYRPELPVRPWLFAIAPACLADGVEDPIAAARDASPSCRWRSACSS